MIFALANIPKWVPELAVEGCWVLMLPVFSLACSARLIGRLGRMAGLQVGRSESFLILHTRRIAWR